METSFFPCKIGGFVLDSAANPCFQGAEMIYIKDHKTPDMFDPFPFMGPKRKRRMEQSWARIFREHILLTLPVDKVIKHYNLRKGAPTKELYSILGLMVLQQMHDLTDEEAVDQFAYNIQWHYALDITSTADADAYVSPKTIWNMRDLLTTLGLYKTIFQEVTKTLAEVFKVDVSKQRIDSIHILSNMRHLGRIGLFVKTIKKFLVNLKRHHKDLYEALDKSVTDRYMSKQGEAVFSMVKPSQSMSTLETLANDLFGLVERFKGHKEVAAMTSYQLIVRLLKEQCIIERINTHETKITVKANKDVPSDSLQNPSDPDAGYDGHKGKGYQVQIAESYQPVDKSDEQADTSAEDTNSLNLITSVIVEPAHKSDANATIPLIESTSEIGLKPREVVADSLYGSDDNCQRAKQLGVDVVSPVMGKQSEGNTTLTEFTIDTNNEVTACPAGCEPVKVKSKDGNHTALFSKRTCRACLKKDTCPTHPGKKGRYLRYTDKSVRLAHRRSREETPEFKDKYRYRAGIEATMSQLDRLTGIKRLRVRGLSRVSFAAFLKAAGVNILRAAAYVMGQKDKALPITQAVSAVYNEVKERFILFITALRLSRHIWQLQRRFATYSVD